MSSNSKTFSSRLLAPVLSPVVAGLAKKLTATSFTKLTNKKPPSKKNPGSYVDNLLWAIALTTVLALAQMLVQKFLEKDKN